MNKKLSWRIGIPVFIALGLSACTTAKLEARLEANPQCKEIVNPKTGALMPCPGSDRSFYVAAGLEAPRQAKVIPTPAIGSDSSGVSNSTPGSPAEAKQATADCKPQIHKKTGGMLSCPPVD
jgi:hypothetical protein